MWNVIVIEEEHATQLNSEPYDAEQIAAVLDQLEAATVILLRASQEPQIGI